MEDLWATTINSVANPEFKPVTNTEGFKTALTARLLAAVVLLEAFVSWSWFFSNLNIGYRIHAREHFTVNCGVCGGLILLASIGAGKYTMDNFLKKTE
jgi:uncharacterized membrane protein YphA (DoxX/SURF4 family)